MTRLWQKVSGIAAVGQNVLHLRQVFLMQGKGFDGSGTICYVRGSFLTCVITLFFRCMRILHTLCANDEKTGSRVPTVALSPPT